MLNFRGNAYSREHTWMSADSEPNFWDFSFEEFGKYDLKACIEFIREEKNDESKISLLGYSEGTTTSFFALSEDP